jgi:hypothetical protein
MSGRGPTRRAALAGAFGLAAAAGAGCRPFGGDPEPPKPDEIIRQRVLAAKRDLLARYAATLAAHPQLSARLNPLVADHRAHVQALNGSASPTATPGSTATAPPPVPAGRGAALAALATAERAAAGARVTDVLDASPRLARVLASIGGCEAAHAELLRGAGA